MNVNDILFLGLARRVAAISKKTGRELWCTKLSGIMGADFVTVLCDGTNLFAYSTGHLYCLEPATGRVLWKNDLPGYGYGLASLCTGGQAAPDAATLKALMVRRSESASSSADGTTAAN